MRSPVKRPNFDSPMFSCRDLHFGLEHGSSIANTNPGSAYTLENFLMTDNRGLKTVTGYHPFFNDDAFAVDDADRVDPLTLIRVISQPLWLGQEMRTGSVADAYGNLVFIGIFQHVDGAYTFNLASGAKDGEVLVSREINEKLGQINSMEDLESAELLYFKTLVSDGKVLFYGEDTIEPFCVDLATYQYMYWRPLEKPAAPTVTQNLPAATNTLKLTYKAYVNFVSTFGETEASDSAQFTASVDLVEMSAGQNITIKRPALPQYAKGWNAYISLTSFGDIEVRYKVNDEMLPPTTESVTIVKDSPLYEPGIDVSDNTTHPLWFKYGKVINGRIWACQITKYKDKAYPYRVFWSGVDQDAFTFGTSKGAGFVPIEGGSINKPLAIANFRDNAGKVVPNVLTGSANSFGKRFTMESQEISTTAHDTSAVETFAPEEQNSSYGAYAAGTVITSDTNLYFLSSAGLVSTQNAQETYNLLVNNIISVKIDPLIRSVDLTKADTFESAYESTRLHWVLEEVGGRRFILCYDFVKDAFTTITVPAEHIFVIPEIEDFDMTSLCFIYNGLPYYIITNSAAPRPLTNRCLFNYHEVAESRNRRPFARLMNATVQFERLQQGDIKMDVNGITKDNVLVYKTSEISEVEDETEDYYLTYNMYTDLYRDNIKTDMIQVGLESTNVSYIISEYAVSYNPIQQDYAKNRFRRVGGTLIRDENDLDVWLLQDHNMSVVTKWVDSEVWDDDLFWVDGRG